jgi:hypothetical protein
MKGSTLAFAVALALGAGAWAGDSHTAGGAPGHIMTTTGELKWGAGPASLPPGAKLVVIEGDPSKEGLFTMRAQLPANYKIPPHWHPAVEHVTVITGTFHMGTGETFDAAKAKALPAGGFAVMPIRFAHFAFTKEETVIQLHGVGPWGITYVNPADDPRNKK